MLAAGSSTECSAGVKFPDLDQQSCLINDVIYLKGAFLQCAINKFGGVGHPQQPPTSGEDLFIGNWLPPRIAIALALGYMGLLLVFGIHHLAGSNSENGLSLIIDAAKDGFASPSSGPMYIGDMFMPGVPREGWVLTFVCNGSPYVSSHNVESPYVGSGLIAVEHLDLSSGRLCG